MKKNNLLIKLLTLLIIIAAVLPVFYMPAYAVEEEYGTQDISDHGISLLPNRKHRMLKRETMYLTSFRKDIH